MFEVTPKRIAAMRRALVRLSGAETRAVSLSFLDRTEVEGLRGMAIMQSFRTATPSIEYRGNSVRQDFDVCFPAPREGVFDGLATCLETAIAEACAAMRPPPFTDRLQLNDFAIQRYPKDSRGIGIHRDGKRYRGIVAIVTLEGGSRLFTCDDREGRNARTLDDRPGRIVLLSAAGFAGREAEDARPLHGVDRVTGGRLSLGFRYLPLPAA
jgi:hypothetical protein